MKCDPTSLWTLVEQTADPGPEADDLARHVESCVTCQKELRDLGGEDSWWDEATDSLQGESIEQAYAGLDTDVLPTPESMLPPIDLSFLDEPSHPEMLGRIGRYDVEGIIGRGGMGVVLRARDSDLQRSVAVKVLAPEWAMSHEARSRFAREAQAAASVAHDNVIPIYNVDANAKLPYLVMRYVPGMTLQRWVEANGPPDTATILRVAGQMAEGLAAAHRRGLIHRDIKPGNVLVGENIQRVWITDFGLARAADSLTLTRTGVIAGTPHYMSPEQARGQAIDQRSDLFSFGCVLFYLCTGHPPFEAENTLAVLHQIVTRPAPIVSEQRQDLPPSLVRLIVRLLDRKAQRRPADCDAVLDAIGESQEELSEGRVARARWPASRRRVSALIGTVVVPGVLLVAWLTFGASRDVTDKLDKPLGGPVNPWSEDAGNEASSNAAVQFSRQIIDAATTGVQPIDHEINQIRKRLDRLTAAEPAPIPSLAPADGSLRRELKAIDHDLRSLETFVPRSRP